ncbi:hypothetical protein, partial [Vibrio alfacsensis]
SEEPRIENSKKREGFLSYVDERYAVIAKAILSVVFAYLVLNSIFLLTNGWVSIDCNEKLTVELCTFERVNYEFREE